MHPSLLGTEVKRASSLLRGGRVRNGSILHKPDTLSPRADGFPKAALGKREMLVGAPCTGLCSIVCGGKRLEDFDVHQDECFVILYTQELLPECIFWVQTAGMLGGPKLSIWWSRTLVSWVMARSDLPDLQSNLDKSMHSDNILRTGQAFHDCLFC